MGASPSHEDHVPFLRSETEGESHRACTPNRLHPRCERNTVWWRERGTLTVWCAATCESAIGAADAALLWMLAPPCVGVRGDGLAGRAGGASAADAAAASWVPAPPPVLVAISVSWAVEGLS